jgi:hypothetical protein
MRGIAISAAILLAGCCGLAAQTAPAQPTLAQLTPAIRSFFHDSAEFPLEMQVSVVAVNSAGRVVEKKSGKGRYNFRGYNPHTGRSQSEMRISKSVVPAVWNNFVAIALPSNVLFNDAGKAYSLEVSEKESAGGLLTAKVPQLPGCSEFTWLPEETRPETLCGASQFQIQKDDSSLQHFSFGAGGLPLATVVKPFGRCQLLRYLVDVQFQKIVLSNDPKPFLIPQRIEVKIDTDKGEIVIDSHFAPRK